MSVSLGKRKAREVEDSEGAAAHGSTLFVSNLPYTATSVDLQTLFSDLAPVRSAFVVTEHGTGVSKGVGYVSFAIREDAQTVHDTIAKEGLAIQGRNLRVQWAENKKQKGKEDAQSGEPSEKQPRRSKVPKETKSGPHDPLAIRTIIISGLPSGVDSKSLWKKVRKYNGAESVEWPVKTEDETEDPTTARALFATPSAAQDAVSKLHAHVFKGSLLSVTLKKRLDSLAKTPKQAKPTPVTTTDAESSKPGPSAVAPKHKGPAPSRASRLIVRNLPWDITEQDLRALFLPYGPIHAVDVLKGFAFVWMLSKKDAESAIEGANGTRVHAGMANEIVNGKQKRKKEMRLEAKRRAAATGAVTAGDGEGAKEDIGEEEEEEQPHMTGAERVIAVDWALSKERWEEEKKKLEEAGEDDADVQMEEPSAPEPDSALEASSDEDVDSDTDLDEENIGVHNGSDNEDDFLERDDEEQAVRPQLPATDVGTTLFVRNVPYEATEDELRTLFRAFGPLRYARITIDHTTGRGRGTGFACFWNKEDADKAIAQSDLLKAETRGAVPSAAQKKNPFKMPSLLTPDPSSSMAQSLVLHGRTLDLARAVTRDEAGKLKEAGERAREKADKRNLYLLREGIILPNTPAAQHLSPAELEKRNQSYNARRALLKSNPSLYVSKTRLSVRQLPLFVSERGLKRLAIHAVRAFEEEAKAGSRRPLSEDELRADEVSEGEDGTTVVQGEEEDKAGKKRKSGKKGDRPTAVKQAKIVRQGDRVDLVTGKGRSKGYGFLELHAHADALRVLRWANNNIALGALLEEWWKAELKDLIEAEEKKPGTGDGAAVRDDARLKKMKEELERDGKKKGTLIVEFSIENVQVVQRRVTRQKETKETVKEQGSLPKLPSLKKPKGDEDKEDTRPAKKPRKSTDTSAKPEKESTKPEQDNHLGSMIGRKRKKRKMGGK